MNAISMVSAISRQYRVPTQNSWQQRVNGFEALQNALQSGDLRAARQALATLEESGSQTASASNGFSRDSLADGAFQALQGALNSGNLSAARQAFATVQSECTA
jgi:hypothetical protein